MSKKILIATAVGSAFVAGMAAAPVASAATNPFALSGLTNNAVVAQADSMPMEGKCGAKAKAAAKAKEGNCGAKAKMPADGKCGAKKPMAESAKPMEGKCGANKK